MVQLTVDQKTSYLEWFSALTLAAWSVFLLLPFDTFMSGASYKMMLTLATEERWGVLGVACALFHMVSLKAERCAFGYEGRIIGASLGMAWWGLLTVFSIEGNPASAAWVIYGCFSTSMMYSVVQLKRSHDHDPRRQPRD